ncbi:MAG: hypothetical protein ABL308_13975 [Oceanicaulis sp.]
MAVAALKTGAMIVTGDTLGEGALCAEALARANVHPESGLATDYLNHFNEAVMALEMLEAMPDMAEDVLAWRPAGYAEHFERTNYAGREVVIAAYAAAPRALKAHFETVVAALDQAMTEAQDLVREGRHAEAAAMAGAEIEPLLAAARAAVNGRIEGEDVDDQAAAQAGIDALFG